MRSGVISKCCVMENVNDDRPLTILCTSRRIMMEVRAIRVFGLEFLVCLLGPKLDSIQRDNSVGGTSGIKPPGLWVGERLELISHSSSSHASSSWQSLFAMEVVVLNELHFKVAEGPELDSQEKNTSRSSHRSFPFFEIWIRGCQSCRGGGRNGLEVISGVLHLWVLKLYFGAPCI